MSETYKAATTVIPGNICIRVMLSPVRKMIERSLIRTRIQYSFSISLNTHVTIVTTESEMYKASHLDFVLDVCSTWIVSVSACEFIDVVFIVYFYISVRVLVVNSFIT